MAADPWSFEDAEKLRRLWGTMPAREIGRRFEPAYSRAQVLRKARKMGLDRLYHPWSKRREERKAALGTRTRGPIPPSAEDAARVASVPKPRRKAKHWTRLNVQVDVVTPPLYTVRTVLSRAEGCVWPVTQTWLWPEWSFPMEWRYCGAPRRDADTPYCAKHASKAYCENPRCSHLHRLCDACPHRGRNTGRSADEDSE